MLQIFKNECVNKTNRQGRKIYMPLRSVLIMFPHAHLISSNKAPRIRMRHKGGFLILTGTGGQPKPKKQAAKQQKREVRTLNVLILKKKTKQKI